jgi:ketosteroid isomerase-like protein
MSQENVEVVRQPMSPTPRRDRGLQERLLLRFPRLFVLANRAVFMLPPKSGLRRRMLRRNVELGIAAVNRGDYNVAFASYAEQAEYVPPSAWVPVGVGRTRGRAERISLESEWRAEWGDFAYAPEELYDLGDRVLLTGRMKGSGNSSGAGFDIEWADLFHISGGRIAHDQVFFDRAEAFRAAGLSE